MITEMVTVYCPNCAFEYRVPKNYNDKFHYYCARCHKYTMYEVNPLPNSCPWCSVPFEEVPEFLNTTGSTDFAHFCPKCGDVYDKNGTVVGGGEHLDWNEKKIVQAETWQNWHGWDKFKPLIEKQGSE